MSAAAAVNTRKQSAPKPTRIPGPCPFCRTILSVPSRYNAVTFCPKAKRVAVGLPANLPHMTLIDGHRVATVDAKKTFRPRSGLWRRIRASVGSAWATWRATR